MACNCKHVKAKKVAAKKVPPKKAPAVKVTATSKTPKKAATPTKPKTPKVCCQ